MGGGVGNFTLMRSMSAVLCYERQPTYHDVDCTRNTRYLRVPACVRLDAKSKTYSH